MPLHPALLNINLLAWVSSEYTVVSSTVCRITESVEDAMEETTDCLTVLENCFGIVARSTYTGLVAYTKLKINKKGMKYLRPATNSYK